MRKQIASAEQEHLLLNGKARGVISSMTDFQKTTQDLNVNARNKDKNNIEDLEGAYTKKLQHHRILDMIAIEEIQHCESNLRVLELQLDERELRSVQASEALKKNKRVLAVKAMILRLESLSLVG